MVAVFEDRIRDVTTTTGTGNISTSGVPPINYRAFSSVLATNDTFPYAIVHRTLGEWEVGVGTCTAANTFSRSVRRSSNANALVNFSAGTKDVVLSPISDKAMMSSWLGVAPAQRLITAGPVTITGTDQYLNLNISAPLTINLPASATRSGLPLTFKDIGGNIATNNVTLTPNGTEKIDTNNTFVMSANRSSITLNPFNDGTNSGWFIT